MSSRYSSADFTDDEYTEKFLNYHDRNQEEQTAPLSPTFFDIDLLLRRLEEYKAQVDETEARLRPQGNLSRKEVADVAAAARFREEIERRAVPKNSSPPSPTKALSKYHSDTPRSPLTSLFEPFTATHQASAEVSRSLDGNIRTGGWGDSQSAQFPIRSTSLARRQKPKERESPARSYSAVLRPSDLPGDISYGSVKLHQRSITISDSRHSVTNSIVSTTDHLHLPRNPDSNLPATDPAYPKSESPLLINPPNEDQIRREMESLVMQDGSKLLGHSLRDHGINQPMVHVIELEMDPIDKKSMNDTTTSSDTSMYNDDFGGFWTRKDRRGKMKLRHKLSIFRIMQKRTTTDKLIEMYMDDHQLEELKNQRKLGRLTKFG